MENLNVCLARNNAKANKKRFQLMLAEQRNSILWSLQVYLDSLKYVSIYMNQMVAVVFWRGPIWSIWSLVGEEDPGSIPALYKYLIFRYKVAWKVGERTNLKLFSVTEMSEIKRVSAVITD